MSNLTVMIQELEADNHAMRGQLIGAKATIQNLQEQLKQLREELGRAKEDVELKQRSIHHCIAEGQALVKQVEELRKLNGQITAGNRMVIEDRNHLQVALGKENDRCNNLQDENRALKAQVENLNQDVKRLHTQRDQALEESYNRGMLLSEKDKKIAELESYTAYRAMVTQRDEWRAKYEDDLQKLNREHANNYRTITMDRDKWRKDCQALQGDHDNWMQTATELRKHIEQLNNTVFKSEADLQKLNHDHAKLLNDHNELQCKLAEVSRDRETTQTTVNNWRKAAIDKAKEVDELGKQLQKLRADFEELQRELQQYKEPDGPTLPTVEKQGTVEVQYTPFGSEYVERAIAEELKARKYAHLASPRANEPIPAPCCPKCNSKLLMGWAPTFLRADKEPKVVKVWRHTMFAFERPCIYDGSVMAERV